LSWVPSIIDFDSRNLRPSSLQVISGSSGSSTIGGAASPFGGQVKAANFACHSSPGFCAQAIGSSTSAPLAD
jgi:hypothetical protein